jgi:hypothetical protein
MRPRAFTSAEVAQEGKKKEKKKRENLFMSITPRPQALRRTAGSQFFGRVISFRFDSNAQWLSIYNSGARSLGVDFGENIVGEGATEAGEQS